MGLGGRGGDAAEGKEGREGRGSERAEAEAKEGNEGERSAVKGKEFKASEMVQTYEETRSTKSPIAAQMIVLMIYDTHCAPIE